MRLLPALVAVGIALVGCSSSTTAPQPFGVPTAPSPAQTELTPEEIDIYGPRVELPGGLLKKELGKVAAIGRPEATDVRAEWTMRVVLDKIEIDPDCGPYRIDAGRAHTLVLSIRVETSDRYNPTADGIPQYFEWATIGPDGVTEAPPTSSSDCRNGKGFPSEMRPAAKYRGEITVDSDNAAGQLVFANMFVWDYPQE